MNIKPNVNNEAVLLPNPADINNVSMQEEHEVEPDWMHLAAQLGPPVSKDFVTAIKSLSALLLHRSQHVVNSSRKVRLAKTAFVI